MVIEGGCISGDQEADLANLKVNIGGDSNGGGMVTEAVSVQIRRLTSPTLR